jgi:phosphatidylglycerophosphate synthase
MRKFNIADWLSICRIFCGPLMLVFLLMGNKPVFAWLLLLSFITDILDGYIARLLKITSSRGAMLDTIADVIIFVTGLAGMLKFEKTFLLEQYKILGLALVPYFATLIFSIARYGKPSSFHTYLAKAAAVLQGLFLLFLFFFGVNYWFFIITVAISSMVSIEEFFIILFQPSWKPDVKGLYWVLKEK